MLQLDVLVEGVFGPVGLVAVDGHALVLPGDLVFLLPDSLLFGLVLRVEVLVIGLAVLLNSPSGSRSPPSVGRCYASAAGPCCSAAGS